MLTEFSLHSNMDNGQREPSSFKDKLIANKKSASAFGLLIVVTCVLLGISSALFGQPFLFKLLLLTSLGVIGFLHIRVLSASLATLTSAEKLVYSLLLTLTVTLLLCLFYLFNGQFGWLTIVAGGCAFLTPYLLLELWQQYKAASVGHVLVWYYGQEKEQGTATVFLNSIPLKVKIQTEAHGRVEEVVSFKAPVRMKLGTIFYHIVQEQIANKSVAIEFFDAQKEPYGWVFFKQSLIGWTTYLDPGATLVQNEIKPNEKVIARRVTKQALLAYKQKEYSN